MECTEGELTCSDDATEIMACTGGLWVRTHCMRDELKLCEDEQCVDPWRHGSPSFGQCDGDPAATAESLADKAQGYDDIAQRLHVHPELPWMMGVTLPCETPECTAPLVPEASATWQDVEAWHTGENDGLWSALYLTSQAYRYAVTQDAEALAMIKLLLEGQRMRMAITGVPGIYTRQLIPPNMYGISCPSDPAEYLVDEEKDDNMWVRVGSDGCVQVVDESTMDFVSTDHCGLDEFAGWCWLDNVSEDEYSGHMLAHAAVARLVDDGEVQEQNAALLDQIGQHLVEHKLELYDWDGRRTEHGKLWGGNVLGGYMATMTLAFMKTVAVGTGDPTYQAFIDQCMLMRASGDHECLDQFGAANIPYDELVWQAALDMGCKSNWNNFSMHMLSLHTALMLEQEPTLRATFQAALKNDMFDFAESERPLRSQNNALWDFIFAADKALGPASDGPDYDAVENGICMLRQFPASEHLRDMACPPDKCEPVCEDRFDRPMTDYARPMAERCLGTFIWWKSPYSLAECTEDLRTIKPPADYLLPYWMGRYYGFIDETM
ncbi:MAG: hypothetical protein JRI68_06290 [Deltaproteobacteria bacterium]|nr:hypothetical protein [Deltaproteobacteria bacterium]